MPEKKTSFKQKREFLKNHTSFSLLSNNLLKKIVSRLQIHHYGAGQIICKRGKAGNSLYIIHTGSVIETLAGSRGEEITVAILREGNSFGTISLLTEEP
ncbi:MAG: cyclic nucleotide-binding domain-containing protein, partial [Planctomycetota bacterium]